MTFHWVNSTFAAGQLASFPPHTLKCLQGRYWEKYKMLLIKESSRFHGAWGYKTQYLPLRKKNSKISFQVYICNEKTDHKGYKFCNPNESKFFKNLNKYYYRNYLFHAILLTAVLHCYIKQVITVIVVITVINSISGFVYFKSCLCSTVA